MSSRGTQLRVYTVRESIWQKVERLEYYALGKSPDHWFDLRSRMWCFLQVCVIPFQQISKSIFDTKYCILESGK